ncbi:hypothetical protein SAMN05192583_1327 [Sphingomonas gellani]|uniref:Uncharacterized protein n=1 Tax=Sphingomonas gellani TaxID=1166340 RepID=A0A1H8BEA2_9SPHN|nr:hypothetical protein [Sphingomonas gellani]SEM81076.1 hypothetical protein SAMN05192583_1327 [Sphingomonas gellani]
MAETGTSLAELSAFLVGLQEHRIHYQLASVREGAVMVQVAVPGERWEVEFFPDRGPDVEIFRSNGDILGSEQLTRLVADFGE